MFGDRRWRLGAVALAAAMVSLFAASAARAQDTNRVLVLINQNRAANGHRPLVRDGALDQAAQRHANDMASHNRFDHYGSDGSNPIQRMNAAGYHGFNYGENIHQFYTSADDVVNGWMNSPPHRAKILNPDFTDCGIAFAFRPGTSYPYWCLDLGARQGGPPSPPPSPSVPSLVGRWTLNFADNRHQVMVIDTQDASGNIRGGIYEEGIPTVWVLVTGTWNGSEISFQEWWPRGINTHFVGRWVGGGSFAPGPDGRGGGTFLRLAGTLGVGGYSTEPWSAEGPFPN